MSLRASITGEIVMDDVFVPEGQAAAQRERPEGPVWLPQQGALRHRLGRDGRGGRLLAPRPPVHLDRKQFGRPLARTSSLQKKLADMQTEIALGLQGCLRVGRLMDEGSAAPEMISDQAQQLRQGARHRPHGARHARRQRHP
jgi:glutaryl-CoA dehydrogenase